mgnify:CR=1 FL=1
MKVLIINALVVGVGGFFGTIMRYVITIGIQRKSAELLFPLGTMLVNMLGCFAVGLIAGLIDLKGIGSDTLRLLLVLGFLGGFTTYSAFGFETFILFREGDIFRAFLNILIHITFGLFFIWIGYSISSK